MDDDFAVWMRSSLACSNWFIGERFSSLLLLRIDDDEEDVTLLCMELIEN